MAVAIRGRADINDDSIQILAEEVKPLDQEKGEPVQPAAVSSSAARQAGDYWHPGMGAKLFIKIPAHLERPGPGTASGTGQGLFPPHGKPQDDFDQ